MDEIDAFCRHIHKKQDEKWKEHADKFPHLRVWLADQLGTVSTYVHRSHDVLNATFEYGGIVSEEKGISLPKQILHQHHVYKEGRVPPECYYALGMYDEEFREKARFYVGDRRASTLLHHLAQLAPQQERDPLVDKIAFFRYCCEHNFPTIPILATFKNGSLVQDYKGIRQELPRRDLFSKPATAYLGRGARTWTHHDGNFRAQDGRLYDGSAMIETLKEQSNDKPILLQPCATNHPRLQDLSGGLGPSTLRIITIRPLKGPPEFFAAFATVPIRAVAAPTFTHRTALAARVDPVSGTLDVPRSKQPAYLLGMRDDHPTTGQSVTGFQVPYWEEAKALALEAHAPLSHIVCVGWDLIVTPTGPRLLEGNNDCSAAVTQITHQRLLGLTRFPGYFCQHLRKREAVDTAIVDDASLLTL